MAKFVLTQQNRRKLIYDGYGYVFKQQQHDRIYWKCDKSKTLKCHASARTSVDVVDGGEVWPGVLQHTHESDPSKYEILSAKNALKRKATDETMTPAKALCTEILGDISVLGATNLPKITSLTRNIGRYRRAAAAIAAAAEQSTATMQMGTDDNKDGGEQEMFEDEATAAAGFVDDYGVGNVDEYWYGERELTTENVKEADYWYAADQQIAAISMDELQQWSNENPIATGGSIDPNAAFIVDRFVGQDGSNGKPIFRVFLSSPRLLSFALKSDAIQADSTHRIVWRGFYVNVVGTSDEDGKFFPLGVSVCSGETSMDFEFVFRAVAEGVRRVSRQHHDGVYFQQTLVYDGSDSIANASTAVFSQDIERVVCSKHFTKAIENELIKIADDRLVHALRYDLVHLRQCPSEDLFDHVAPLFLGKWKQQCYRNPQLLVFLDYFEQNWIRKNATWYEGFSPGSPSTNDGLASIVRKMKSDRDGLRPTLSVAQFLYVLREKLLRQWSLDEDPQYWNCRHFSTTPTRSIQLWMNALRWLDESKKTTMLQKRYPDGSRQIYVASEALPILSASMVEEYRTSMSQLNWSTFTDYAKIRNAMWTITINDWNWEASTCSCSDFLRTQLCKHSLGMAVRLKLCQPPPQIARLIAQSSSSSSKRQSSLTKVRNPKMEK